MKSIDWPHLLFQFDGRINRAKFWIVIVAIWVVELVVVLIMGATGMAETVPENVLYLVLYLGVQVAIAWPALAVLVKRWHDRGKPGWFVLVALIPFVGWLWVLIECGFLEGDSGDNEYGPNPLAH